MQYNLYLTLASIFEINAQRSIDIELDEITARPW